MTEKIIVMAIATPKKEHFQDCIDALLELQVPTLKEPGCLQFEIMTSKDADGKIYFFEQFADKESFDLHFTYEYTKKVFALYENWLAEEIEIKFMTRAE